ncbi:MAG: GtrA family protein [Spongiibacteraceae bacterium]
MFAELIRFGIVGIAAMATHWCVVALLVPLGMQPLLANVIAFCIAFNISFFGHHHWTFASTESQKSTLKRFMGVALLGFISNECLYALLLRFTALDYRIALLIVLIAVAAMTYLLSRLWAFRSQ